MFTGIVLELAQVVAMRSAPGGGARLTVRTGLAAGDARPGDSIAINGACLTVTDNSGGILAFDLSAETLKSTTLGSLAPGERVNVEPALQAGGRLGGHFVTGHVDAVGRIRGKRPEGLALRFEIESPPEVTALLIKKGSVAVDGISLTVVDVLRDAFTLVIIPHTAALTTLGFKGPGHAVNLETDMIGKYVMKLMGPPDAAGRRDQGLMKALQEGGFAG